MAVDIRGAKSTFAKLLASENLIIQHKQVPTASFNPKSRVLTLPIFKKGISEEVLTLLCAHEVGHALYTPDVPEVLKDRKFFPYANIVEDVRVEKLIKRKFAGLVRTFNCGYSQLHEENFFGTKGKDITEYGFADRLNLHIKTGIDGNFTAFEDTLVEKAKAVLTFEDTLSVAREIQAYDETLQNEQEQGDEQGEGEGEGKEGDSNTKNKKTSSKKDVEDSEGEDQNGSSSEEGEEDGEGEDQNGSGSEEGEEDSEGEDQNGSGSEEGEEDGKNSSIDAGEESKEEEEKDSENSGSITNQAKPGARPNKKTSEIKTSDVTEAKMGDLIDKRASNVEYYNVSKFNLKEIIVPTSVILDELKVLFGKTLNNDSEFREFKIKSVPVVSYLHKEFEMKKNAEQHKRAVEGVSGTIDCNMIHKYRYSDNIFKKMTTVPDGKSHGLIMYLDFSGSMEDKFKDTVKQLINLALFCKRAGISFEVYAFSNNSNRPNSKGQDGCITVADGFELLNLLSSKLSASKFNESLVNLWNLVEFNTNFNYRGAYGIISNNSRYKLGGTPLNSAILVLPNVVEKFREEHKSQIIHAVILTDGEATDRVTTFSQSGGRGIERKSFIRNGFRHYPTSINQDEYQSGANVTGALLNYAKEVSGINIVGFFLTQPRDFSASYRAVNIDPKSDPKVFTQLHNTFKSVGNVCLTNQGYDEVYIIKCDRKSMGISSVSFTPATDQTDMKTAMKEAKAGFIGLGNSLKKQRVILNKFISIISNPKHF